MLASAPDAVPAEPEPIRRNAILVVDDEESFRTVVVRQLREAGYATIEAHDGADAITKYAEHRAEITAVLLDLVMPNTSGGETLAILRFYNPARPVVSTSGSSCANRSRPRSSRPNCGARSASSFRGSATPRRRSRSSRTTSMHLPPRTH